MSHVQGEAQNAPNTWLRLIGQNKWMKLLAGYVGDVDTIQYKNERYHYKFYNIQDKFSRMYLPISRLIQPDTSYV